MNMTPEDALAKAKQMLVSEEFAPIVGQALTNAKDVPTAAATLVYPIIYKMMQETGLPQEELLGTDDGDGIAIHLLLEVFEIADEAGIAQAKDEQDARAQAEQAVSILADLLDKAMGAEQQAMGGQPSVEPQEQMPQPGLLTGGA
jgi:hypothetical protein